jgi:hypothetical protein
MRIIIETLPPDEMRLPEYREIGCGDWFTDPDGVIHIQVASATPEAGLLGNLDAWNCALHEQIEMALCMKAGVAQAAVDAFDASYTGDAEPGDAQGCPYLRQHRFAALIDHMVAHEMGIDRYGRVDWEEPT